MENEKEKRIAIYLDGKITEIREMTLNDKACIFCWKDGIIQEYKGIDKSEFVIYESNKEKLFEIGNEDIVVYKSNRKEESYCQPSDEFVHEKELKTYFPSNDEKKFIPERIQVFQMVGYNSDI